MTVNYKKLNAETPLMQLRPPDLTAAAVTHTACSQFLAPGRR